MADSIKTEAIRNEQTKLVMNARQDREAKELAEKNRNEIDRLVSHHEVVKNDLNKAYELTISQTRDEHTKRLEQVRQSNMQQLNSEKLNGEEELEKVRSRFQEQIGRYRENSERYLDDLRRKTEASALQLKRSAEKTEKAKA